MKRTISAVTAASFSICLILTGCFGGNSKTASEFDDGKMRRDLTAQTVAKEMGLGINLGNTMEAYWEDSTNQTGNCAVVGDTAQSYETCWGAVVTTQEAIDGMKSSGFDTVRIPVYWGNMMADDQNYVISEDYFTRVEEILNYCRKNDQYVVINIHHYDEFLIQNKPKDEVLAITKKLWTQIAERFQAYSDYVVFEGFNESLGAQQESDSYTEDERFDYVNEMNQTFVDAVRATGGNNKDRILIASGYWTNIDLTTDQRFEMPKDSADDKLMVSVHYVDNAMYWTNQIGSPQWLKYSTDQCELLKNAFTDQGIPVFVGECTSIYGNENFAANADTTDSTECLRTMLEMITDYGFVPVLWDTNANFYSRTENKIISDTDSALIAELSSQIHGA